MALVKWSRDGYGMLERNRVQTHNVESQCLLNATDFPNGAEVGSIVAVDKVNSAVTLSTGEVYGLLANAEVLYNPMAMGLKNYHVEPNKACSVLFLEKGNTFTTNTLVYDNAAFANEAAVVSAIANASVYGGQDSSTGQIALLSSAPASGLALQAVKATTMPDGQKAVKFIVIAH